MLDALGEALHQQIKVGQEKVEAEKKEQETIQSLQMNPVFLALRKQL